ncbi:MAG: amino acid--tRNA ligase-related protein, partial [Candidatus Paceibacterota bacterium]
MALDEIRKTRIEKLNKLKEAGIDPHPAESSRTHKISEALVDFDKLADKEEKLVLAGRLMAKREHGGSAFLDLYDGSGTIQVFIKKDIVGDDSFNLFMETVDVGDFVEFRGHLFKTKKEERTLEVEKWTMLAKSILPLPEKWHGLQDVEERYRKRYLDILFNPDVKEKFEKRSRIIKELRNFMDSHDFMEVVTPTLQPLYGGASARPFK